MAPVSDGESRSCGANALSLSSAPYLSVVVTARNDDHGGNLLGRMQIFVNALLAECDRHELPAELIVVEWNPPCDRPPLAEALRWPPERRYCDVRIIQVPPELHRRFAHWRALPLYQMIAKNVGIRRACGEFILATNIDILFSGELMRFLAERRLERGKMYRVDRFDVMSDVPADASVDEQLAYCESHLLRLNAREGVVGLEPDGQRALEPNDVLRPESGLRLGRGWFPRELAGQEPFRWVDTNAELVIQPSGDPERVLAMDVEPGPGMNLEPFVLQLQDPGGTCVSSTRVTRRGVVTLAVPPSSADPLRLQLHAVGSGTTNPAYPRPLKFRVWGCELARTPAVADLAMDQAKARIARAPRTWASRASRWLHQWRAMRNHRSSGEPSGDDESLSETDILPSGVCAIWGSGWHPVEFFRGEMFRWMQDAGTVVLFLPPGASRDLTVLVESGPALGFKPFQLQVCDQSGSTLATAVVKGRTEIQVPLPRAEGAFVLMLRAQGGGRPKRVLGESRRLAVRVLRFGWTRAANDSTPNTLPPGLRLPSAGVWCGPGWIRTPRRQGRAWLAALREAELVLCAPHGSAEMPALSASTPILEVQPYLAESIDLSVRDCGDRVLYRGRVTGKQQVPIPEAFPPGGYYVLRLLAEPAGTAPHPDEPLLALSSVGWSATQDGKPVHIRIDSSIPASWENVPMFPASSEIPPVHLHTNACGDFTLMAREHWLDLRAYTEFDMFSMHLDSLFCWAAHHGGAREQVLTDPLRIYHIEHGSGWTPEGEQNMYERIAARGIPWLDFHELLRWAGTMNSLDAPMIFNRENWGLAGEELKEIQPDS
jgi:hypothetical protein